MRASWRGKRRSAKGCSKLLAIPGGFPPTTTPEASPGGLLFLDAGLGFAENIEGRMQMIHRRHLIFAAIALAACGRSGPDPLPTANRARLSSGDSRMDAQISKYAALYDVPANLVHRVIRRESTYDPAARNGPYMGLMQIHPNTARGMGYAGPSEGLLDAETNLKYAVKYLRGAWLVSDGDFDTAISWYARGYYYEAKRRGMLEETGLR